MTLSVSDRKTLKQLAHHLSPIVTFSDKGLTKSVQLELQRALDDHELIKVQFRIAEKETRLELIQSIILALKCHSIQAMGKTAVLYKRNPNANPKLSNVARRNHLLVSLGSQSNFLSKTPHLSAPKVDRIGASEGNAKKSHAKNSELTHKPENYYAPSTHPRTTSRKPSIKTRTKPKARPHGH